MNLLSAYAFSACFAFHEDIDHPHFYLYDTKNLKRIEAFRVLKKEVQALGVGLLTGIDDPSDALLGYHIEDGYKWIDQASIKKDDGTIQTWAMRRGLAKRFSTPEVPGRISQSVKDKITDAFFRYIILNDLTPRDRRLSALTATFQALQTRRR
jgi:hypothetical protein